MIKVAFNSFIKNLPYVFVPMGVVFFGLLVAIYFTAIRSTDAISDLLGQSGFLFGENSEQAGEIAVNYIVEQIKVLDYSRGVFRLLRQLVQDKWIYTTTLGLVDELTNKLGKSQTVNVEQSAEKLGNTLVWAFAVIVAFVLLANFVTGYIIRRKNARRTFFSTVLVFVVQPLLSTSLVAITAFVTSFWSYSSILLLILSAPLLAFTSLVGGWIAHGRATVKLKKIITKKNVGMLALSNMLFIVALVAVVWLVVVILGQFAGILLAVPLFIYTMKIIDIKIGRAHV